MDIRLITFDLDDTLWDVKPVLLRAEERFQDWLSERYPNAQQHWTREELFALRQELLSSRPELRHQISLLRIASIREALCRAGVNSREAELAAQEGFDIFLRARHEVALFDQVEEVLLELSRDYTLAALTNGNADIFRLELGACFSFAYRAEELDAGKPDPAMFRAASRRAGVGFAQMIHVGDHAEHDIAAAAELGICAIWVNRSGVPWPGEGAPDAEIREFSELPRAVRQLAARNPSSY